MRKTVGILPKKKVIITSSMEGLNRFKTIITEKNRLMLGRMKPRIFIFPKIKIKKISGNYFTLLHNVKFSNLNIF